ncbi:MAG: AbrB/MazE/SpoVT family DNA-binding domain-containing protein [Bacteroidetes bacterium]|nr:AbrB/MazE/SpoVT family DNA-binding domain-containing protein [Bacteroidota bacterium]MBU1423279.1 AbrB/MazE/SpoVT family DNA-binding domain-containing protein [Bacteroidota bacterium]
MKVKVTSGGRITIPTALRKKFGIKGGTRIKVFSDEKLPKIILSPLTREAIDKYRGILKVKKGEDSMTIS